MAADETLVADFSASVSAVALDGITVLGARAMVQAEALSRQKNAPNIVNVVASDQMGRFPDASAPDAVQRIPEVAIARDQGEGRYIQIRGGSAANTQVTFNGIQIPSPEGDVRQIALDAVPVDILESIEVSKASAIRTTSARTPPVSPGTTSSTPSSLPPATRRTPTAPRP